jgi:hypothetical protein
MIDSVVFPEMYNGLYAHDVAESVVEVPVVSVQAPEAAL